MNTITNNIQELQEALDCGLIENRRSFFVLGAQGSGTYMLTEALVATGQVGYNSKLEKDPIDPSIFNDFDGHIVVRRSLPHAGEWPKLFNICHRLSNNYTRSVTAIAIIREPNATLNSLIRRWDPEETLDPSQVVRDINRAIFLEINDISTLSWIDFLYITYEAFCLSEGFRRWLFEERLQLPYPENYEIKYANEKYYA